MLDQNIKKFIKMNELASEIQEIQEDVKLGEFISDRIKNNQEIIKDKIVFAGIDIEDYNVIKYVIDKQKGK